MTQRSGARQSDKIIVQVDPELQELIPGFLENRRKDIQSVGEALGQGDFETIRVLGHSMKGSGWGYGFEAITEIGGLLEQAAKTQDTDGVRKWLGELATYLERVEVVFSP